jgi:predicted PurR-regulated permease PerM
MTQAADPPLTGDITEENPFGLPGAPVAHRSPARHGFGFALGALAAYGAVQAIISVRQVLVLLLISGFLAVGLDPAVSWLERRMRRGLAVGIVVLVVLGFVGGFVAAAVPPITRQATSLVKDVPRYVEQLQQNETIRDLDQRYDIFSKVEAQAGKGATFGLQAVGGVIGVGKAVLGALASAFLILVLTLYLLGNLDGIKRGALRLVPASRRARVGAMTDEILTRVGGYVLGALAQATIAGLVALVFFEVIGAPSPVALALFIAMADLVPLVGATIGSAVAALIVGLSGGLTIGLVTFGFFLAYQQVENYVIGPNIMRRAVDVSPLTTVIAALIGGSLLGIVGALLAIPSAAALQLIGREVLLPRQEGV